MTREIPLRSRSPAERFGRRVAAARAARGWSMRELCAKAGVAAPSTIKRCEDDGTVSLSLAVRIAAVLGVSMDGLGDDAACWTCGGRPPRGFTCNDCGSGSEDALASARAAVAEEIAGAIERCACEPGGQCADRFCTDCVRYFQVQADAALARTIGGAAWSPGSRCR